MSVVSSSASCIELYYSAYNLLYDRQKNFEVEPRKTSPSKIKAVFSFSLIIIRRISYFFSFRRRVTSDGGNDGQEPWWLMIPPAKQIFLPVYQLPSSFSATNLAPPAPSQPLLWYTSLHRSIMEMAPPPHRTRKRPYPASYQSQQGPHQQQHYKPPAYLLPNHHDLNLDFYDPVFRPIFNTDQMPPPVPVDHTLQNFYGAPPAPPAHGALHSDNCSSCCDNDNCTDKCDNEDCNDGCDDCADACHIDIAHCSLECEGSACPVSPCTPVPCSQAASITCQTVVCEDEVCPVEAGICAVECVDAIYCHDGSCQEKCHTLLCMDACPETECDETTCPDYICPGTATPFQSPSAYDDSQNCVSFHVNNANSNRWRKPHSHHPETTHYSSVSPNSLTLNSNHLPPFNTFLSNPPLFSDYNSFSPSPDMGISLQPAPKRRKASDTTSIATPVFDQGYSTTPSSMAPTPASSNFGDIFCLWDDDCDETFFDNLALHNHIQSAHIGSQKRCLWDGCGQESSDPNSLFDHVRFSHAPPLSKHVCMWEGCDAILNSEEELQSHLNDMHLPSASQCKWDTCETFAPTEVDLEKHVHAEHLILHLEKTPDSSSSASSEIKRCEWQHIDAQGNVHTCGSVFQNSTDLQQHAKDVHINALRKKTGYHCHWAGCTRRDKPFSQKGKVERHLQTHTGFKSCTCELCGKEFSAPQALQQHIRTHTGEKPYKCDVCGKEFAQGSAMTMHRRTHTGERPLMCDYPGCGKRFSESSNLSKHRKTHNPVGQHACNFPGCDRSFHRIDQMKRHQKTHGVIISSSTESSSSS